MKKCRRIAMVVTLSAGSAIALAPVPGYAVPVRESPTVHWQQYLATSNATRSTADRAPVTRMERKAGERPISASERSQLAAAIKQTLSAKSVVIDVRWPSGDGATRSITLNRPDRVHTETTLRDGAVVESISIGRDTYEALSSAPHKWAHTQRTVLPEGVFESTLGPWLHVDSFGLRDGASYVGEISDGGSLFEVRAQLAGNRVVALAVTLTIPNPLTNPRILPSVMRMTKFDLAAKVVAPPVEETAKVSG